MRAEPVSPAGTLNFRDLGGLPAGPGRRTRSGVLFRSDTLQALSDADVALLVEELGLEVVIDLRVGPEAIEEGRGPLVAHDVTYLNAPLRGAEPNDEPPDRQALLFSLGHLEAPTSVLGSVVRAAAAFAGRPTVVHCAAGKDRTGLVVSLLLALAGVDREAIVADYLASGPNMAAVVERFHTWPRYAAHMASVAPELYQAHEETVRGLLDALDERYGGARGWARARGLDDDLLDRFPALLTEPAG
ncbi:tyrosine-protein phosphatase [Actinomycetospora sp. TBRC 11914]|uniref:tyrosine-protein phosphatase n=1 Tax=Actinomycetospora sp. TBRC 11914 TaxID=2729387 RepID=UPI00145CCA89|nr:tyrosine-protein phosphatase [Actinomycetospora sp. TBRC 11914]NMO90979.1 tyrosine-protein phosphatase [Actinomycetospora sp. TBRC 11914]